MGFLNIQSLVGGSQWYKITQPTWSLFSYSNLLTQARPKALIIAGSLYHFLPLCPLSKLRLLSAQRFERGGPGFSFIFQPLIFSRHSWPVNSFFFAQPRVCTWQRADPRLDNNGLYEGHRRDYGGGRKQRGTILVISEDTRSHKESGSRAREQSCEAIWMGVRQGNFAAIKISGHHPALGGKKRGCKRQFSRFSWMGNNFPGPFSERESLIMAHQVHLWNCWPLCFGSGSKKWNSAEDIFFAVCANVFSTKRKWEIWCEPISAKRNENPWNIEGKIIIYGPRCEWDLESLRMAIPFRSVKVSKYASSGDEHTAVANKDFRTLERTPFSK